MDAVAADGQADVQSVGGMLIEAGKHQVDVGGAGVLHCGRIVQVAVRRIVVVCCKHEFKAIELGEVGALGPPNVAGHAAIEHVLIQRESQKPEYWLSANSSQIGCGSRVHLIPSGETMPAIRWGGVAP